MIGLYVPGTNVIYRTPTLLKLAILTVTVLASSLAWVWWQFGIITIFEFTAILISRVPFIALFAQIAPVFWVLGFTTAIQWWFVGLEPALITAVKLFLAVTIAALFTATTTVTSMLDAMAKLLHPFRRWVDPDRIGLLFALTIRCIPMISEIIREVADARKARGTERSVRAFVTPTIIRTLQTADALGEALIARGLDD